MISVDEIFAIQHRLTPIVQEYNPDAVVSALVHLSLDVLQGLPPDLQNNARDTIISMVMAGV